MKLHVIDWEQAGNNLGTRLGTLAVFLSVSPFQAVAQPFSVPLPPLGSQAPRCPDLVGLSPQRLRLGKTFFEHLGD
jgi:hypothetical protein